MKLEFLKRLVGISRDVEVEDLKFVKAYGYYHEIPAITMDYVQSMNSAVWQIFDNHIYNRQSESNEFWILGKSFSQINISPKKESKCENFSCYEKSLKTKKICKQGIL